MRPGLDLKHAGQSGSLTPRPDRRDGAAHLPLLAEGQMCRWPHPLRLGMMPRSIRAGASKVPRPIALQNRVRSAAVLISAPAESAQDMFSAVVSIRVFLSKIRYPVACGRGSRVLVPGA